jgi:SAM-dependent methyltransferase
MLRRKYANTTGSEFLGTGGLLAHAVWRRVRHENIAKLSFPDGSFDYVLCFEVLEHVFEYRRGLQECFRCLKPAGRLVLSVPFDLNSADNVVLAAETSSGTAFYVHPPEYHADPIRREGALCYYHFGWSLLDELKGLGFRKAEAILYWSRDLGYLGGEGVLLVASKAGPSGSIKTQEGGQFPALPPA